MWRKLFMQQRTLLRTAALLGLASAALALPLFAQDSSTDSVAEAARRARAQKKAAAKPATVITDDTLKPAPSSGSSAPVTADNTATASPASAPNTNGTPASGDAQALQAAAAPSEEEEKKKQAQIEALKQEVVAKQAELDLVQREMTLDNEAYYSKPSYQDDKAGAAKLAAEQTNVNQKKEELAALNAKLADLGFVAPPPPPPAPVGPMTVGPPRP
jgi:CCR4-NOT transcriptional regulation complex NOT5 subunit